MNAPPDKPVCCGNPACKVADQGKCIEGLELTACTNYGKEPRITEEAQAETVAPVKVATVQFTSAQCLTVIEATQSFSRFSSHVVAIVGPHDSGKTSLIARVYELFQGGPIDEFSFAGSRTLHAFEWVAHCSRAASELDAPTMERTRRGEVTFYHFDVGRKDDRNKMALLLADRAGEEYQEAVDDIARAREHVELSRADAITLLVDGERMKNIRTRHSTQQHITMTLRSLFDAGILQSHQRLALVLTKLDAIRDSDNCEQVEKAFSALFDEITQRYETVLHEIRAFKIAAQPKSRVLPAGYGVVEVFKSWLSPKPVLVPAIEPPTTDRAIDRYYFRETKA